MRTTMLGLAFMVALPAMAQTHQTVVDDFTPSSVNQPGQQYPRVNSQRYARFRIVAPQAQSVRVSLGGRERGGFSLEKGEDGVWTGVTQKPLDEGFHYYHLTVDGGTFNDPGALNFYGSTRWESGIEVPAHDQDFYALSDVPHGRGQQVLFPSKLTSSVIARPAYVYTPPDYDRDTTNDVNNTAGFREKVKVVFASEAAPQTNPVQPDLGTGPLFRSSPSAASPVESLNPETPNSEHDLSTTCFELQGL